MNNSEIVKSHIELYFQTLLNCHDCLLKISFPKLEGIKYYGTILSVGHIYYFVYRIKFLSIGI